MWSLNDHHSVPEIKSNRHIYHTSLPHFLFLKNFHEKIHRNNIDAFKVQYCGLHSDAHVYADEWVLPQDDAKDILLLESRKATI